MEKPELGSTEMIQHFISLKDKLLENYCNGLNEEIQKIRVDPDIEAILQEKVKAEEQDV